MTRLKTRCFNLARLFGIGSALVVALWLATAIAAPAQTFKTLVGFDSTDGVGPYLMSLVQDRDRNFYGTTQYGGANGQGVVFKITAGGKLTTLYNFCPQTNCTDGMQPNAGLVLGTDGNFYGTTYYGGAGCAYPGCGTAFKITPNGKLTTLHSFADTPDGAYPFAGLVQGTDGNFYGTTWAGGGYSSGEVFRITPKGTLTTLYSFGSQENDGEAPYAGLVQGTDGNFYGTTHTAGAYGDGTVFKVTPGGKETTLHSFDYTDGKASDAGWCKPPTGTSMGQQAKAGLMAGPAPSSRSPQGAS
jgi:uncharacterized repeat protein (TIGR03803 family)